MGKAPTIEVPLPEGVQPSKLDLELLKATFQAIVTLRTEGGREWEEVLCQLERDGWNVHWGLCWHAEARRGDDYEQASGKTLDGTFAELAQLARLDMVGHCP
jgi:hypothetical protein